MKACSLLVNLRKGLQRSGEQPFVGEERYVTTIITAAKETNKPGKKIYYTNNKTDKTRVNKDLAKSSLLLWNQICIERIKFL